MRFSLPHRVRTLGLAAALAPAFLLGGCTDLSVDPFSAVQPDNFYRTEEEVLAAVSPVYAQLRSTTWAYFNLSEVSSDEQIVPTRGSDWGDGGRWLDMHRQTWSPGLVDLNDAWVASYTGVARANGLLRDLEGIDVPNKASLVAEIRALRAFYYYQLLDLFGNVPLVGDEPGEFLVNADDPQGTEPRAKVFAFIESELLAAQADLPVTQGQFGRMTKGAVDAILANLYLNAPVWTGTVSAGGLQRGPARWQDAFNAANRVITSGRYSLASDWKSNFAVNNENHPEHIFVVQHLAKDGLGVNFANRSLHYNSFGGGGAWNGFSTIAETYNAFDKDDSRIGIFAAGQAIDYDTGQPINNRAGSPLIFTIEFPDATGGAGQNVTNTTEGAGVRIVKFPVDPNQVGGNHSNDYAFFRLGEMYLIRAEAAFELGNTGQALSDLNRLRARVFEPDEPLATVDRATILRERLFELTVEAKRRQDLIRIPINGQIPFVQPWSFKSAGQPYRILFPIPQQQIDANPNLVQNPGY